MNIYLFPYSVSVRSVQKCSPVLYTFFTHYCGALDKIAWDGELTSLPATRCSKPTLVWGTKRLRFPCRDLMQRCDTAGMLPFYRDRVFSRHDPVTHIVRRGAPYGEERRPDVPLSLRRAREYLNRFGTFNIPPAEAEDRAADWCRLAGVRPPPQDAPPHAPSTPPAERERIPAEFFLYELVN